MAREFKDSGIEWIGQIPKEWTCLALLHLLKGRITDGPHETPILQETGIPFISVDSLNDTDCVDLSVVKKFISQEQYLEYQKKSHIEKGDILFSKAATIGKTAIVKDELFMVWSPLAILKPSPVMCFGKYLYYILNSDGLIKYVSLLGTNNTQINVGMRALEKAIVPKPSLPEQQKIADYLDKVCGEVDEMVALQEKMIEELKAYKQSVITEAVTKGLNPNVPMKDSGIDWIGEIPERWSIVKLSLLTSKIGSGSTPTGGANVYVSDGVKFLRSQNVFFEGFDLSDVAHITDVIDEEMKGTRVQVGDVLLNITGGSIGRCYFVDGSLGRANVNQHVSIIRPTNVGTKYLKYFLQSFIGQNQVSLLQTGGNREGLSAASLSNFKIVLPSDIEQQQIASYLDTKCSEIDSLIAIKQQKIEELKEYKKSVIYEYVTGKKEVA